MHIQRATLETCGTASGMVVAIDVLRAFSTAAYAFAAGAREILLVGTVDEAFQLRQRFPDYLLMGEAGGLPVPGFDFSNSPTQLLDSVNHGSHTLQNRGLIQRTSAGTQGIVLSRQAQCLFGASFVVASATAKAIQRADPTTLTFVITGTSDQYDPNNEPDSLFGIEDAACADFIECILRGNFPDPAPFLERVKSSGPGRLFSDPARPDFPDTDLELCSMVDRFDFAMQVERKSGLLSMAAYKPL